MNAIKSTCTVLATALFVIACKSESPDAVTEAVEPEKTSPDVRFEPGKTNDVADRRTAKGNLPFDIAYRVIGTPVVGSPVTVELQLNSVVGPRPVNIEYRINDASAMSLAESQLSRVRLEPAANEASMRQEIRVIPQREGRLYLNVSASFETEDGTTATAAAIPIQVGTGGRELEEHGRLETDDGGEAVRVLEGT